MFENKAKKERRLAREELERRERIVADFETRVEAQRKVCDGITDKITLCQLRQIQQQKAEREAQANKPGLPPALPMANIYFVDRTDEMDRLEMELRIERPILMDLEQRLSRMRQGLREQQNVVDSLG